MTGQSAPTRASSAAPFMTSQPDQAIRFAENRANWDDRAALHEASGYGTAELLASPGAITREVARDTGLLGDLTGLDVIHLQCHLGLDTISLSRLGARRVAALDLSPRSPERARALARPAGPAPRWASPTSTRPPGP